jgi:pSer/pThr/pTyr-binding forkhead associated (FHA) protein
MGWLKVKEGHNKNATYRLGERNLTIGRDQGNLIQVVDDLVSRRHAMIRWENGKYRIIDLRSRNGTTVNNTNISERLLNNGDLIRIGPTVFMFEDAPAAQYKDDAVLQGKVATARVREFETVIADFVQKPTITGQQDFIDTEAEFLKRERNRMKMVYKLSSKIKENVSLPETFEDVMEGILSCIEPDRVILFMFREEGTKLSPVTMKAREGLENVLKTLSPMYELIKHSIVEKTPVFNDIKAGKISAAASVPLLYKDYKPFGAVYLDFLSDESHPIMDEDKLFLKTIANEAAFAIARDKEKKQ